ncbi:MAG: ABC transporter permease subunit [Faecalibacterium sp.]
MNIFKQIFAEAKNMLRSKFILISIVLAFFAITIGTPLLGLVIDKLQENSNSYYYGNYGNEDLIVNGVTIDPDNDFYWDILNLVEQQEYMEQWFSNEGAYEYALELSDLMLDFYVEYAPLLTPRDEDYNSDYRMNFMYTMRQNVTDIYVLNVMDPSPAALQEAVDQISWGSTDVTSLLEMENEDAQEYIATAQQNLDEFDTLMKTNDFSVYVDMQMRIYNKSIEDNLARIETLEADIIANPDQEEYSSEEIERLLVYNKTITETDIPELEYRLEQNIIPNDGSWEDQAISTISSSKSSIEYATLYKMTEEEYNDDQWTQERYGSYKNYLETIENNRKQAEKDLFVAQSSLDSGKPDMQFVPNGARQQLYNTFSLSMLVVVFGALLGGWCIANEFQSGTVRLLMIRPRTRMVVLFTRYAAGLVLVYALYLSSFLVNFVVKGVVNGFADYMLPNYTANATVLFGLAWLGDLFAVSMGFVFIYSFSFAMSTIIKNMAVSIILPTLALLGSTIAMAYLSSQPPVTLLAYTPMPYLIMSDFFGNSWNALNQMIEKGVPLSLPLGAAMLALYSVLLMAIAAVVFQKKDITN